MLDVFDILGIAFREDSYTDLIATAFDRVPEFRTRLLEKVGETDDGNWYPRVRMTVRKEGRTKDIPDLLLINKSKKKAILVEKKIDAEEGPEQTRRYSSSEFKRGLADALEAPSLELTYYILALDPTLFSPVEAFNDLSYKDIVECIPNKIDEVRLSLLLQDFSNRVLEASKYLKEIHNGVSVQTFLNDIHGMVTKKWAFAKIVSLIQERLSGFDCIFAVTHNRDSTIPLCLIKKPSWVSESYFSNKQGNGLFNIHFELQWRSNNLDLFLHYETSPYLTKKDMQKYMESSHIEEYEVTRKLLANEIISLESEYWSCTNNRKNQVCKHQGIESNVTIEELASNIKGAVQEFVDTIDKYTQQLISC